MPTKARSNTPRSALVVALLAAGALATLPALAGDHGRGGRGGRHGEMRGLGHFLPPPGYLDLDASQRAALETIREQTRNTVEPLMDAQRELRGQLRDAVKAASPDATAIGNLTLQIHANRRQFKAIFEKAEADFTALLNADQREKYQNFRELRRERREHRRDRNADRWADDDSKR